MTDTASPIGLEQPEPPESRATAIRYLAAVLLLPLLVLWRQDNTLFTGPGYIDPWLNFGFFRNLVEFKRNLFPGSAEGSHLSWLLPGATIHSLFSPVAANCILHLGVFTVATVSLFLTLKWVVGARRAFLATLLFSVNPWLWFATGWDYGDGAAIAYCLLAIALLTRAALVPRGRSTLMAAGMALAALVYVNLYWVIMAPLLPLYCLALSPVARRTPVLGALLRLCLWIGAGCAMLTVALGATNYFLDGHFFFYAPTVLQALHAVNWKVPWFQGLWIGQAPGPWLWSGMVATATALAVLASRRRNVADPRSRAAVLFSALFLWALAWTAFLQVGGIPAGIYRASNLLPFSFLVIGVWFWPGVQAISTRAYVLVCCVVGATLAIAWLDGAVSSLSSVPHPVWFCSAFLAASLAWRHRPAGMVFLLALFMALTACSAALLYNGLDPFGLQRRYESLIQARARIESARHGHAIRFWYDETDPALPDAAALTASYIWLPSLLSRSFAAPPCDMALAPSTYVASISTSPAHGMDFVVSALGNCWSGQGLHAVPVGTETVNRGSYAYTMSILRVEPVPGRWQPVTAVFHQNSPAGLQDTTSEPVQFPLSYFAVEPGSDTRAALRLEARGVEVRTHAQPDSLAAIFPVMTAAVAGRYRFAMRYWPGAGSFRFGAYVRQRADPWLSSAIKGYWTGTDYEAAFWMDLAEGQEFQLALANNNGNIRLPASLLMKSVSAIRLLD